MDKYDILLFGVMFIAGIFAGMMLLDMLTSRQNVNIIPPACEHTYSFWLNDSCGNYSHVVLSGGKIYVNNEFLWTPYYLNNLNKSGGGENLPT